MVACQPLRSKARRSSPRPEKLPKEKVLRVGETSRWSSWSRKGTPILRWRFFPVWWKGMEPFLSRSSRRFLNYRKRPKSYELNILSKNTDKEPEYKERHVERIFRFHNTNILKWQESVWFLTFLKMFIPRSEERSGTAWRRRLVRDTFAKVSELRDLPSSLHFRLMSYKTEHK